MPDFNAGRVNIVMRTKDRPGLLTRAIDDVLAQSYEDWTLTLVNDGGDSARVDSVVSSRADILGDRVEVIHNAHSRGMEAASNQAVRRGQAEFVAIHDDDDTWAPSFLAATVAHLQSHPQSAVAVRTEIVWERISNDHVEEISREVFLPQLSSVTLFDLLRFNTCVPISLLIRRSALDAVGLFDESLPVTGDWECNLRLAAHGGIGFIDGVPLAYWHQRPASTGPLGNSVVDSAGLHRIMDRQVRDRALRGYVGEAGLGLPLYLTRFLDDRFDEVRDSLQSLSSRTNELERQLTHTIDFRVRALLLRLTGRWRPGR